MSTYTTVDELKKHLNIEAEYIDDDAYLLELITVAEIAVFNYCNGGLVIELETLPVPVKHACLFLAAHFYTNRTPIAFTNTTEIPYTLKFLLSPYRVYAIK